MRYCALIALLLVLFTSCALPRTRLQDLRRATPVGNTFQTALYHHYLQFAEQEAERYDWISSGHFATKGLFSAYGNNVPPENPDQWRMSEADRVPLLQAHGYLKGVLTQDMVNTYPQVAADAQYYFDCWVEEQAEDPDSEDVIGCRENFYEALDLLYFHQVRQAQEQHATYLHALARSDPSYFEKPAPEVVPCTVFFDFDSTKIKSNAKKILEKIVEEVTEDTEFSIVLHGHTDRAGKKAYNKTLSERRAEVVRQYLMLKGIKKGVISIMAHGESKPMVPTEDGKAHPKNRRVEIVITS